MVCTLRPPGVSMAMREQLARALHLSADGRAIEQLCERALELPSSPAVTHSARRSNTRVDISAAAALV